MGFSVRLNRFQAQVVQSEPCSAFFTLSILATISALRLRALRVHAACMVRSLPDRAFACARHARAPSHCHCVGVQFTCFICGGVIVRIQG
jgi:hypothetical protein